MCRRCPRLGYSSLNFTFAAASVHAGPAIVVNTSATLKRPAVTAMKLKPAWAPAPSNVHRTLPPSGRSEERRVGKEARTGRGQPDGKQTSGVSRGNDDGGVSRAQ